MVMNLAVRPHYRSTYPAVNPKDRFTALREAQSLLKCKGMSCAQVLNKLSKAENSVEFKTGSFTVQFTRGFGVWSGRKDTIQLSIEIDKEDAGEIVAYKYDLNEIMHMTHPEDSAVTEGTR